MSSQLRKTDLHTAAAYHFLGLSTTDYLIDVAHAALENGIYAHGLGEIATLRQPTFADVGPFFDSALRELQLELPSRERAIGRVAESYMVSLAEGPVTPLEITSQVYSDHVALGYKSLGPLNVLFNHFYRYDHFRDNEGQIVQELADRHDLDCIALARRWCREHWLSTLDSSWLTSTVLALAKGIEEERAFERLPILADALQDAGCDNADILDHCRGSRPHVRGCWVIDLLLRKS